MWKGREHVGAEGEVGLGCSFSKGLSPPHREQETMTLQSGLQLGKAVGLNTIKQLDRGMLGEGERLRTRQLSSVSAIPGEGSQPWANCCSPPRPWAARTSYRRRL